MKLNHFSRKFSGVLERTCVVGMLSLVVPGAAFAADQWIKPTAEELAMKSVPAYPGVPAIYLYREEISKDDMHVVQHYERLKVLTEKGKDYANVELNFVSSQGDGSFIFGDDKTIGDISGRTIHADGTVIPFTGKPYLKTMEKGSNYKYQARVFTLPDVEVGSIIEYRYATRYNDNVYEAPSWYIQGALFTRAAHYAWYPATRSMVDQDEQLVNSIAWFPVLPEGVTLGHKELPGGGPNGVNSAIYEVTVKDVPPNPDAEFMPPIKSFTYRVLFSYTAYRSGAEYWKAVGKHWSKRANSFIGPDNALTAATQPIIGDATTQDQKLRKIYAAVMALENTDYTRDRAHNEDKASGLVQVKTAIDVLKNGRGNSRQLSYLFIGMARAAGMKAYAMRVPNRRDHIFTPTWLQEDQLVNVVAIVSIDGKEQFFAPGERYTPYGNLEWEYTYSQGQRQTESGVDFAMTPAMAYKDTHTSRVANLRMAEDGTVTGSIDLIYNGATALRWRQKALSGDEESLRHELRTSLEEMVPKTLEVKVKSIDNLTDYEKPLTVKFEAKGTIGSATGKRLVLPVDFFLVSDTVAFPQEKRELPVYFHYPEMVQDALRINLPPTMTVEAVPAESKLSMPKLAVYTMNATAATNNVTVRRDFIFGDIMVDVKAYPELRKFYSQFQAKDQESMVLKLGTAATTKTPSGN